MLKITRSYSADAALKYYDNSLKITDYYVKEIGIWGGKGAGLLGLKGEVKRRDFAALVNNRDPRTGERLTQRTNTTRNQNGKKVSNRRAGYDFTFSVPKSVSVYLGMHGDPVLEGLILEAVSMSMQEVERRMETKVRKGYAQENRVSPVMVYGSFLHTETRPVEGIPDPHTHVHVFVMNATHDEVEQEWKAIEVGNTAGDRTFYEAYFNNVLAQRMVTHGYGIRRTETHFELASASRELVDKFSRRHKQIEQYALENAVKLEAKARELMKRQGMAFDDAWAHVVADLGVITRDAKSKAIHKNRQDLQAHWWNEMTEGERACLEPDRVKSGAVSNLLEPDIAKELALRHLFEHVSIKRELHVAAMLLRRGIAKVSVQAALDWVKKDARFTPVQHPGGNRTWTTRQVRDSERSMIERAERGRGQYEAIDRGRVWCAPWPFSENKEQCAAVRHLLQSRDFMASVHGPAGSGKTQLMREAVDSMEVLSGKRVCVLAPSSSAVEVLEKQGFCYANTLQMWQASDKKRESMKGQIIWVDEAGFMSIQQMVELQEFALKNGCRLILSGDTKQHHGVQRGDALRILEDRGAIDQAHLTKIYRQKIPALREAIQDISQGRTALGFDKLDKFGVVQEVCNEDDRHRLIAQKYIAAVEQGRSCLVIAPTHEECDEIARTVTRMRVRDIDVKLQPLVRLKRLNLTEPQKSDAITYAPGQVVEFHKITKGVSNEGRFKSGEQWEVVSQDAESGISLCQGTKRKTLPLEHAKNFSVYERRGISVSVGDRIRFTQNCTYYGRKFLNNEVRKITGIDGALITLDKGAIQSRAPLHIDQGIAITSHASQGKTVDLVIVSVPVKSFSQANEAQFYVSMSRARSEMMLITDSKVALREAVCRPSKRLSWSDIVHPIKGRTHDGQELKRAMEQEYIR